VKVVLWDCVNWGNIVPLILNMVMTTLGYFSYYVSMKNMPMMLVITIKNLSPIITVIIAAMFLRERINLKEIVCLALAFSGIYVLVRQGSSKEEDDDETE